MIIWIDMDTGTVLNGPVLPVPDHIVEDHMADDEVLLSAINYYSSIFSKTQGES